MVNDPRIQLVNKPASHQTGIGRYALELERGLRDRGVDLRLATLRDPTPKSIAWAGRRFGYDLTTFFESYPFRVDARAGYVSHLTSQTLGALLLTQRLPRPVVVTVHDILPYLLRDDPALRVYRNHAQRLMDVLAMRGLKRADRLIADSNYTRSTMVEALKINPNQIDVVHLGVDTERFRPRPVPDSFRARYELSLDRPYVLHVGSEDPRKNLPVLLNAMKLVRQQLPNAVLLKVGAAAFAEQRQRHMRLCNELGLSDAVRWFDAVPEDDLPLFYNAATVFAFPSLYEGFGFPVLEALGCGVPVIAANASSIPELVGDAATLIDGHSAEALATGIIRIIAAPRVDWQQYVSQAASFSWSQTVTRTLACYAHAAVPAGNDPNEANREPSHLSRRAER